MHAFTLLFLVALVAHAAVQLWLAWRQTRFVEARAATVPAGFASVISPADHAKAAAYTVAKQRLGMVETVYELLIALGLTVGGGIALVGAWSAQATDSPLLSGTLHVLGWDHPDEDRLAAMLARQEALLAAAPAQRPCPA